MTRTRKTMLFAAGASLALAGAAWSQGGHRGHGAGSDAALIRSATSAAPASVGRNAAVIAVGADGTMRTVRPGTNGFTCMADNPETPGPDPMCGDANSMAWAMAWIQHRPPTDAVGLMYMLAGGTDA